MVDQKTGGIARDEEVNVYLSLDNNDYYQLLSNSSIGKIIRSSIFFKRVLEGK